MHECSGHVDNGLEQSEVWMFEHPRLALTWHGQSLLDRFVQGATCLHTRKCTHTPYHGTGRGNSTNGETCQTSATHIRIIRTICYVGTARFLKSNVSLGDHYVGWIGVKFSRCVTAWCGSRPWPEAGSRGRFAQQSWFTLYRLFWILMHIHTYTVTQCPQILHPSG